MSKKKVFELADIFLSCMPEEHIRRWCPESYSQEIGLDHRMHCWNEIVDVYSLFPIADIDELWEKYVKNKEDMGPYVLEELELEVFLLQQMADFDLIKKEVLQPRVLSERELHIFNTAQVPPYGLH